MLTAARFIHTYGAGLFLSEAWPTQDKVIPWRLFVAFYGTMDALWAKANLEQAQAIMASLSNVLGSKNGPGKELIREMARKAYPEEVF